MSENSTNFPPRSYSSSFYSNSLAEDEKTLTLNNADVKKTHLFNWFISMMKLLALLFALRLASPQAPTKPTNCVLEHGATRVFRTPLDYQGTNSSFDPHHPTYRGNVVEFASLDKPVLSKNFFVSFDSDHIVKMSLRSLGATAVQEGAFLGLFCLQELDLGGNNISALGEGSFEGLQNLQKLDLSSNALASVSDDGLAFVTLKNLRHLDLSHNRIESLQRLSFMAQARLEVLHLGFNRLRSVPLGVFDYLAALRVLRLDHNQLSDVSPETWKGLAGLESLDLAGNRLRSFDPAYNFSFVGLRSLNLSGNSLRAFDALGARRHLPLLAGLDLRGNSLPCDELATVRHFFSDSKVVLAEPLDCGEVGTMGPSDEGVTHVDEGVSHTGSKEMDQLIGQMTSETKMLEQRLRYIETVLVGLFVVVLLLVALYLAVKTGACRNVYERLTGVNRRHGYLNNDETVLLTGRLN